MMVTMEILLVVCLGVCLAVAVAALTWLVARRSPVVAAPVAAPQVSADVISQAAMLAVEQAITMSREQLGAHTQASDAALAGRQQLIDQRLGEVQTGVRTDIDRLAQLVQQLGQATSERFGQVDRSLQVHSEITQMLSTTTNSLREALASSNARGQWGERMAEDVLRLAGFHEGVNYHKRTAVVGEGSGIPDFTFLLPKGHVLFMDVKFPMAAYLKFLDAGTEAERSAHRATFVRDVRARVRELARREYASTDDRSTVDNVLVVRAQRDGQRLHPRERFRADRRGDGVERRHLLAAHVVRLSRSHPSGVRQLRHRGDQPRDPATARQVRPAVVASTPTRSTR